jgi:hypothetical protein
MSLSCSVFFLFNVSRFPLVFRFSIPSSDPTMWPPRERPPHPFDSGYTMDAANGMSTDSGG